MLGALPSLLVGGDLRGFSLGCDLMAATFAFCSAGCFLGDSTVGAEHFLGDWQGYPL
jgi:hypothetical protein